MRLDLTLRRVFFERDAYFGGAGGSGCVGGKALLKVIG